MCIVCNLSTGTEEGAVHAPSALSRRTIVKGVGLGGAGLLASACVPSTIGQTFAPPQGQIRQAADQAWAQQLQQRRPWNNQAANQMAQRVASRLIPTLGPTNLAWEVRVFDDPAANAFALPNGKIGLYRGMIQAVANDDQLAAVVGHELGHVTANHAAQRAGTSQFTGLLASVGGALLGSTPQQAQTYARLFGTGGQLGLVLPFSRQQELEADQLGVVYMARAGYDPRQAVLFWERQAVSGGGGTEFLSTHPSDATRLAQLRRIVLG